MRIRQLPFGLRVFSLKNLGVTAFLLVLMMASVFHVEAVTWSANEHRLTTYAGFDGIPSIVQTRDGRLWIFWSRKIEKYSIYYATSSDLGLTWSEQKPLITGDDAGDNTGIIAFQASDDTIWLFWSSDRTGSFNIYYKNSFNLGVSWSDDTQLTTHIGRDLKPSACQLSNGTIWVAWTSDRSGAYDIYLKTTSNNGVSWSDDIRLTFGLELDKSPSIAQTSDGVIWLFYSFESADKYDIYYKTYVGSTWSSPQALTDDPKEDTNPYVLQTLNGEISCFWSSREPATSEPTTDDIFYKYSSDNGVTWSVKNQLTTDTYDDMWSSVIQASNTGIFVVWTSDRADQPDWGNYDIYFRMSLVGDVNEDRVVDITDLSLVGLAFACFRGEPNYNPDADLNWDGIIDVTDLSLVSIYYGST